MLQAVRNCWETPRSTFRLHTICACAELLPFPPGDKFWNDVMLLLATVANSVTEELATRSFSVVFSASSLTKALYRLQPACLSFPRRWCIFPGCHSVNGHIHSITVIDFVKRIICGELRITTKTWLYGLHFTSDSFTNEVTSGFIRSPLAKWPSRRQQQVPPSLPLLPRESVSMCLCHI